MPDEGCEYDKLARRLAGPALVRFSGALWKDAEVFDVLGCAVRFRYEEAVTSERVSRDQDLLFATVRRPWTMPLSPLLSNARDFLGNDYFAVSPFEVEQVGRLYFRLRPERAATSYGPRTTRLDEAVARGAARLHLETASGPWGPWRPVVVVRVTRRIDGDDDALRFDPFADGRGIRPVGYVQALRRGAYAMSQLGRPKSRR